MRQIPWNSFAPTGLSRKRRLPPGFARGYTLSPLRGSIRKRLSPRLSLPPAETPIPIWDSLPDTEGVAAPFQKRRRSPPLINAARCRACASRAPLTGAKRERVSAKHQGWSGMPKCFVTPDHPVRSIKGGFAPSLVRSRPPLLYEEGSFGNTPISPRSYLPGDFPCDQTMYACKPGCMRAKSRACKQIKMYACIPECTHANRNACIHPGM
jgi:hypothetical protein